jgi:hypothetical protein
MCRETISNTLTRMCEFIIAEYKKVMRKQYRDAGGALTR